MSCSSNIALAKRWFEEVWNQRRSETIDELLTPESVCRSDAGVLQGPEGFKALVHAPLLAAFPDVHVSIEGVIADGDDVVVRWRLTGTHSGPGLGIAPTNLPVSVTGMTWIRYRDGKMMEGHESWNIGGLMEHLRSSGKQA